MYEPRKNVSERRSNKQCHTKRTFEFLCQIVLFRRGACLGIVSIQSQLACKHLSNFLIFFRELLHPLQQADPKDRRQSLTRPRVFCYFLREIGLLISFSRVRPKRHSRIKSERFNLHDPRLLSLLIRLDQAFQLLRVSH